MEWEVLHSEMVAYQFKVSTDAHFFEREVTLEEGVRTLPFSSFERHHRALRFLEYYSRLRRKEATTYNLLASRVDSHCLQ